MNRWLHFVRRAVILAGVLGRISGSATAQSPVTLTIAAPVPANPIPSDFSGFSFETGSLRFDHYRPKDYFFDSTNTQLLTLFRNLGIKSLRIGGNSVEGYAPERKDIDALFRFAEAAGVKVIYSVSLATGDPVREAAAAQYVSERYGKDLVCLAIGNEPNSYGDRDPAITGYASFVAKWDRLAAEVRKSAPTAKLGGPDTGNGATAWAAAFAQAEAGRNNVAYIFTHYEPGGASRGKTARQLIDEMLSPACDAQRYPACYDSNGAIAQSLGLGYRFTEANSHVATPDVHGENHSFATALFALDFLHWWAAHHCLGVNFHTGLAGFNAALVFGANGDYRPYPIGYGIAAFNVGGHGAVDSVAIKNPDNLNLTAYAVTDSNHDLYVTVINREHGPGARDGRVEIDALGQVVGVMDLTAPNHDAAATAGVTLGGAIVSGGSPWQGRWRPVDAVTAVGCAVKVEACSAAVVKFSSAKISAPAPD